MSTSAWHTQVVPAQLAFLAIYNPTLGPSDETFPDQLVFYYSRASHEARVAARKHGRNDADAEAAAREERNEKLRQMGLAQGMVDFARSFSDGEPVDSIETDKSRIVLHELESGWWILASIDLTRLPSVTPPTPETQKKGGDAAGPKPTVEYSSREVSSAALLTQQLLQAHYVFTLHHGPSLTELYVRLSRDKFCSTLERYWTRFCRTWDVLLHGNPAADVFSGLKVASGGELGFGVGEEEWGSGEREVLEDVTRRTEGMIDAVVSRFGEPDPTIDDAKAPVPEEEVLPWMGRGSEPIASDGIIFSGIGAIARPSLRNIALWMRQIYTHGEYAYGVRDNPLRERRKRRRRNPPEFKPEPEDEPEQMSQSNGHAAAPRGSLDIDPSNLRQRVQQKEAVQQQGEPRNIIDLAVLPKDNRPQIHDRTASQDHALEEVAHTPPITPGHPGIPPPIVTAAEQALDKATQKADQDAKKEAESNESANSGTTMGIPDQYMKYLTFGLSELGRTSKPKRPSAPQRTSTSSTTTLKPQKSDATAKPVVRPKLKAPDEDGSALMQMDPMPDGESLRAKAAMLRRQEDGGHFVIGLKGDLEAMPEGDHGDVTDGSFLDDYGGSRTVLRTIQVEMVPDQETNEEEEGVSEILQRKEAEMSSARSGVNAKNFRRTRVLIYVRRPFIYCFLFDHRTPSLSYPQFYREMHRNLQAIHKPLLSSTSVVKVAQRIESSHNEATEDAVSVHSAGTNILPSKGPAESAPIFDLIYDPRLLTLHTSIPNIPDPGTPAAEGLVSGTPGRGGIPGWTRVEALTVHNQILNTLTSVKNARTEIERTSKTNRGWWIVWMRVPPSAPSVTYDAPSEQASQSGIVASSTATMHGDAGPNAAVSSNDSEETARPTTTDTTRAPTTIQQPARPEDMYRTAFLVRKSTEASSSTGSKASAGSRMASGVWASLTLQPGPSTEEKAGGVSAGWGPAALAGGIGFDARRYVEGLLSLNR